MRQDLKFDHKKISFKNYGVMPGVGCFRGFSFSGGET